MSEEGSYISVFSMYIWTIILINPNWKMTINVRYIKLAVILYTPKLLCF